MAPRGWDCPARLCLQAGGHPGSSGIVPRAALLGTALTSGVTNQEKRSIVERVRESGRVFPVRGALFCGFPSSRTALKCCGLGAAPLSQPLGR